MEGGGRGGASPLPHHFREQNVFLRKIRKQNFYSRITCETLVYILNKT